MEEMTFKSALAALAMGVAALCGSVTPLLSIMVIMMFIDFATGFMSAAIRKELSPGKMFDGGIRKIVMFVVVLMSYQIGMAINLPWLRDAVLVYYIITESLSILENAVLAGVRVPAFLTNLLKKAGEMADEGKGAGGNG